MENGEYKINIKMLQKQLKERKVENLEQIVKKYKLSEEAKIDLTMWSILNYTVGYQECEKHMKK